jgi:hypothetical protein
MGCTRAKNYARIIGKLSQRVVGEDERGTTPHHRLNTNEPNNMNKTEWNGKCMRARMACVIQIIGRKQIAHCRPHYPSPSNPISLLQVTLSPFYSFGSSAPFVPSATRELLSLLPPGGWTVEPPELSIWV